MLLEEQVGLNQPQNIILYDNTFCAYMPVTNILKVTLQHDSCDLFTEVTVCTYSREIYNYGLCIQGTL